MVFLEMFVARAAVPELGALSPAKNLPSQPPSDLDAL